MSVVVVVSLKSRLLALFSSSPLSFFLLFSLIAKTLTAK